MADIKQPDVPASYASSERSTQYKVTCNFYTESGASYYSRTCHALAAWQEYWVDGEGKKRIGEHAQKRCHRHLAVDKRTNEARLRRGSYGRTVTYDPFDGMAVARDLDRVIAQNAEAQRLDGVLKEVAANAAYILKHADLTVGQKAVLESIRDEAKTNILSVS